MDTVVSIDIAREAAAAAELVERAFGWFDEVERTCSRFDRGSELARLSGVQGRVVVSPLLYALIEFSLQLAEQTNGAFDPCLAGAMVELGFDTDYRTGRKIAPAAASATWREVELEPDRSAVNIGRPLTLDLGAVAKGFAIDLAARELAPLGDFSINAGGDVFAAGLNHDGLPWRIGIRNPRQGADLIARLGISGMAVCTSGDYERVHAGGGHILEPASRLSAGRAVSATVVAPSAMLADGLSTAAFVLGPVAGCALLEQAGVDGMIVSPSLAQSATPGFARFEL